MYEIGYRTYHYTRYQYTRTTRSSSCRGSLLAQPGKHSAALLARWCQRGVLVSGGHPVARLRVTLFLHTQKQSHVAPEHETNISHTRAALSAARAARCVPRARAPLGTEAHYIYKSSPRDRDYMYLRI